MHLLSCCLTQSMPALLCSYSLHNKGWEFIYAKDQTQAVVVRRLLNQLSDAAYNSVQSFHSDSAVPFAVLLNHLPDLVQQQPPNVLLNAMQVNLLNLTASAINISTILLEACRKHTGLSVCRLYKDPFMLWVRWGSGLGCSVITFMLWVHYHSALSLS